MPYAVMIVQDHPRVCGEKSYVGVSTLSPLGSPPRVRGKARLCRSIAVKVRITPACAGKSFHSMTIKAFCKDHPRVCGEKCRAAKDFCAVRGSPPRVRGKVSGIASKIKSLRITPACAGKRMVDCRFEVTSGDHPRVCGEKRGGLPQDTPVTGSPPRVRGKVTTQNAFGMNYGITPACAGKRAWSSTPIFTNRDHPRVCGEKTRA